jgi:hypothetical protein
MKDRQSRSGKTLGQDTILSMVDHKMLSMWNVFCGAISKHTALRTQSIRGEDRSRSAARSPTQQCGSIWFLFPAGDCKSLAIICRVAAIRFDSFRNHQKTWSVSSVGQSACLSRMRSPVRARYGSPSQFRDSTEVVQLAVNQLVVGSIPTLGANFCSHSLTVKAPSLYLGDASR